MNEMFDLDEVHDCHGKYCRVCRTHAPLARVTDPDTSHDAAKKLNASTMRHQLTLAFQSRPDGLTAEEASVLAGYSPASGAWKRVSDLLNNGVLVDTGRTRFATTGRRQRVLRIAQPQ